MRRRALWIGVPVLVALLTMAGLMKWRGLPYLGVERSIVSATPTVGPFAGVAPLDLTHRGDKICNDQITYSPDTQVVHLPTTPTGRPGNVRFEASAPGYRVTRTVKAWPDGQELVVNLPTPKKPVIGTLCVTLLQPHRHITFVGTYESRTFARPQATINGRPVDAEWTTTFYQAKPERFSDRLPAMLHHISALSWPGAWLLWVLLAIVVAGVPLGVVAALWLALRADAAAPPPA